MAPKALELDISAPDPHLLIRFLESTSERGSRIERKQWLVLSLGSFLKWCPECQLDYDIYTLIDKKGGLPDISVFPNFFIQGWKQVYWSKKSYVFCEGKFYYADRFEKRILKHSLSDIQSKRPSVKLQKIPFNLFALNPDTLGDFGARFLTASKKQNNLRYQLTKEGVLEEFRGRGDRKSKEAEIVREYVIKKIAECKKRNRPISATKIADGLSGDKDIIRSEPLIWRIIQEQELLESIKTAIDIN